MPRFTATNSTAQTSATEQRYAQDIVVDGTVVRPYEQYAFDAFTSDILSAMDGGLVSVVYLNGPFSLDDLPKIGLRLTRSTELVRVFGVQGQTHAQREVLEAVSEDSDEKTEDAPPAKKDESKDEAPDPAAGDAPTDAPGPDGDTAEDAPETDAPDTTEENAPDADAPAGDVDTDGADDAEDTDAPASDALVLAYDTPAADLHWKTVIATIEKAETKESLEGFIAEDEARAAVLKAYAARFPA